MADLGEAQHAEVIHRAAPVTGEAAEAEGALGGHHAVDRVVIRRRAAQSQHVPVAGHGHLAFGHHGEDVVGVRAVGRLGERPAADPLGVVDARAEAVVAVDLIGAAVGGRHGDAVGGELAGHDRHPLAWEHHVGELLGAVRAEIAGRGRRRHHHPAGRAVGAGQLAEHVERVGDAVLGAAHVAGDHGAVQPGGVAGLHCLVGHRQVLGLGAAAFGVEHRCQVAGGVEQFGHPAMMAGACGFHQLGRTAPAAPARPSRFGLRPPPSPARLPCSVCVLRPARPARPARLRAGRPAPLAWLTREP